MDFEEAGVVPETRWTDARHIAQLPTRHSSVSGDDAITNDDDVQRTTMSDATLEEFWNRMESVQAGHTASVAQFPAGLFDSRSLLSKLSDPFATSSLLCSAAKAPDPQSRILGITRWFLSGLCTRTAGLPLLPVMGEVYRCSFNPSVAAMDDDDSFENRTFVLCEQVCMNECIRACPRTHPPAQCFLFALVCLKKT
jgi:hypothetical protein